MMLERGLFKILPRQQIFCGMQETLKAQPASCHVACGVFLFSIIDVWTSLAECKSLTKNHGRITLN